MFQKNLKLNEDALDFYLPTVALKCPIDPNNYTPDCPFEYDEEGLTFCDYIYETLVADVRPGGQYNQFEDTNSDPNITVLGWKQNSIWKSFQAITTNNVKNGDQAEVTGNDFKGFELFYPDNNDFI